MFCLYEKRAGLFFSDGSPPHVVVSYSKSFAANGFTCFSRYPTPLRLTKRCCKSNDLF